VPWTQSDTLQVGDFRRLAFDVEQPLRIRGHGLRAMNRWFQAPEPAPAASAGLNSYLDGFSTVELPYEYVYDGASDDSLASFESWLLASEDGLRQGLAPFVSECLHAERPQTGPRLLRFMAPLALLMAASRFNEASSHPLTQLYVAQAALSDLPHALQADVETPELVRWAGRGDVYGSSIWLGLEPTYTPWHRDPNPNMFYQLCSAKTIRLAPPGPGEDIFRQVQARLGTSGSSRIRGEEMMQGQERIALDEAIWGLDAPGFVRESELQAGDALFVPKGWWHSVKSIGSAGRINGSVNWWFR